MKRMVSAVMAMLLVLAMSGAAWAEGGTEVSVGVKSWYNSGKRTYQGEEGWKTDSILLVGPAIEVEFSNHVFIEGSYMVSASNYKYTHADVMTVEFDRKDMDLAAGYQFNHNVGVFAGYRTVELKFKGEDYKESSNGAVVGIRGAAHLSEGLSAFGKFSYLFMTAKATFAGESETEKAPGWVAEAGLKYAFTKGLAGSLGYKYETVEGKDSEIKDVFTGFTLDVMYTF